MDQTYINNTSDPLYAPFIALYAQSFPIFEQRTASQQEKAFASPSYHLSAYHEADTLVGFISYWEFETYIYIEHLAVNQATRGKGYGSKLMKELIASTSKIILLEIDPIVDDISASRLRFYQHLGFYSNSHTHTHPPYREGYSAHPLVVLTTQRAITQVEYQLFSHDLTHIVMAHTDIQ